MIGLNILQYFKYTFITSKLELIFDVITSKLERTNDTCIYFQFIYFRVESIKVPIIELLSYHFETTFVIDTVPKKTLVFIYGS